MASKTSGLRAIGLLLRQAVAIFIGVAAALAGQAWFEARAERNAEREYLQQVLEELVVVENIATMVAEGSERRRVQITQVAGLLSRPNDAASADSLARLAPPLSSYFNPELFEAVGILLEPANLRLVRDQSLRSNVADFALSTRRLQGVLAQQMNFMHDEWRAFGLEYFDYRLGGFFTSEPDYAPESRHLRDGSRIAASPEFENLIDLSFIQDRNVRNRVAVVLEEIPELRGLLNARLAAL